MQENSPYLSFIFDPLMSMEKFKTVNLIWYMDIYLIVIVSRKINCVIL